jgi:hypothetical protein
VKGWRLGPGVAALLAAFLLPTAAAAAPRMLVGFQDDPSFRWEPGRGSMLTQARDANATIVRTTVYWSRIAPTRPRNATNPFDSAYRFDDLDEFVREAQLRGMDVLLSVWGTPAWANRGAGQNRLPTRLTDLTAFSRALASRYSGRFAGFPFVRYYSVWNEPNLAQFLSPQFDRRGRPVSPALYARLYRAAYAGLKLGNPKALVAIGETSPRGRDRPTTGPIQDSHSPGRFAELLAQQRPRLQFDAFAHHPYPTALKLPPTQKARWPNVALTQLPQLESSLAKWFGRKSVPIWITEYAYQTNPPKQIGVSYGRQAAYASQALAIASRYPFVQMFVWFVLRDRSTTVWQSGLLTRTGARKPSFARFAAASKPLNAFDAIVTRKAAPSPTLEASVIELAARNRPSARVGITYRVYAAGDARSTKAPVRGRLVFVDQAATTIRRDATIALRLQGFRPERLRRYLVQLDVGDASGNRVTRTLELRAL